MFRSGSVSSYPTPRNPKTTQLSQKSHIPSRLYIEGRFPPIVKNSHLVPLLIKTKIRIPNSHIHTLLQKYMCACENQGEPLESWTKEHNVKDYVFEVCRKRSFEICTHVHIDVWFNMCTSSYSVPWRVYVGLCAWCYIITLLCYCFHACWSIMIVYISFKH